MLDEDYYKAYDKRYKIVHETSNLWEYFTPTKEVEDFIKNYSFSNSDDILDLGCGEGRDAIYLLNKGYNVDACDYSAEAIKSCDKLSNNKYKERFFQLDVFNDNFEKKYNLIYSICVLHMCVLEEHRRGFLDFIYKHLKAGGYALIIVLGDDYYERETDIKEAYKFEKRQIRDLNITVDIPKTSCRIVSRKYLDKELRISKLCIEKKWLSGDVPGFSKTMCTIVKKA